MRRTHRMLRQGEHHQPAGTRVRADQPDPNGATLGRCRHHDLFLRRTATCETADHDPRRHGYAGEQFRPGIRLRQRTDRHRHGQRRTAHAPARRRGLCAGTRLRRPDTGLLSLQRQRLLLRTGADRRSVERLPIPARRRPLQSGHDKKIRTGAKLRRSETAFDDDFRVRRPR